MTHPGAVVLSFTELLVQVCEAREVMGRNALPDGPPGTLVKNIFYILRSGIRPLLPMLHCIYVKDALDPSDQIL